MLVRIFFAPYYFILVFFEKGAHVVAACFWGLHLCVLYRWHQQQVLLQLSCAQGNLLVVDGRGSDQVLRCVLLSAELWLQSDVV